MCVSIAMNYLGFSHFEKLAGVRFSPSLLSICKNVMPQTEEPERYSIEFATRRGSLDKQTSRKFLPDNYISPLIGPLFSTSKSLSAHTYH